MSTNVIGKALERIEIMRSSLRWASALDKTGISKILLQVNQLRTELLLLSRQGAYANKGRLQVDEHKVPATVSERRQALLDKNISFQGVFGENPELLAVLEILIKAAPTNYPVLIEGESGTGKELMAKVVHANSSRNEKPYVSVNCGAIPAPLLESELFGHVKGAFTNAESTRKGKFELAHGGTLFLDELGELSLENQVKLLRALQTGEIQRVGSDENIFVDVRLVAATNKKLYQLAVDGQFREDLYYRLGVITVTIPPLRERRDEIPLLIDFFSKEATEQIGGEPVSLSPKLVSFLELYDYRGNIRELQNIIYRVFCLADRVAGLQHLPDTIRPKTADSASDSVKKGALSLEQVRSLARDTAEEQFLRQQLTAVQGRVTTLADKLDMNRSYLQTLMKKHGLKARDFKE